MFKFWDFSKLKDEDFEEIKAICFCRECSTTEAMEIWAEKNPGKITCLGEVKNGEIIRDEIDDNGVHEFKGQEAFNRMIDEVQNEND